MSPPLLEVKGLTVTYRTFRGEVLAVDNLSFKLDREECLGVVGESGCGKTTLGLAISGLIPDYAHIDGEIIIDGRRVSYDELRRLKGIAMIFQDPSTALNPVFTIGEQILEIFVYHKGLDKIEAKRRSLSLLKEVMLPNPEKVYESYPHELSGGMKQRVLIAMALALEPKLLIADEPTTALDVTVQAQILMLLKKLVRKRRISMMFITHDLGIAAQLCDRIMVMYAGSLMEMAKTDEFFSNPLHPYTIGLLGSIPRADVEIKRLKPIPGSPPTLFSRAKGCKFHERCPKKLEVCEKQLPPLIRVGNDHLVSCFNIKVRENERTC